MSITKIHSRKVLKDIDYTTSDKLVEELDFFQKQVGWSIFEILRVLEERKADSLSITKEKPFRYFYARLKGKAIFIRLQTSEKETEFTLPIASLDKR